MTAHNHFSMDNEIASKIQSMEQEYRFADVRNLYESKIKETPENIDLYTNYGAFLLHNRYYSQAEWIFEQGLQWGREFPLLFNLGIIQIQKYDFAEAVNYFLECITLEPGHEKALLFTAQALRQIAEWQKALFFIDRLLAAQPSHIDALKEKLEIVHQLKDHEQTKKLAQSILQKDSQCHKCYRYLGFAYLFTGHFQKAETAFRQALAQNPHWGNVGVSHSLQEKELSFPRDKKKLAILEQKFQKEKDHRSLGFLYFYRGEHEKAEQAFQKAKKTQGA